MDKGRPLAFNPSFTVHRLLFTVSPCLSFLILLYNIPMTKKYIIEQTITLPTLPGAGWILDIGGGGEGTIGQLCGQRVVAIDIFPRELAEAPGEFLRIIMNAGEMKFLDATFETATTFFFFLFAFPEDRAKILAEIHRVLRPGGRWLLWDVIVPPYPEDGTDLFIVRLKIHLPGGRLIETGYGTPWARMHFSPEEAARLAEEAGFAVVRCEQEDQVFAMEMVRKE
jgi:SAM-dependent methyltransferase